MDSQTLKTITKQFLVIYIFALLTQDIYPGEPVAFIS